jgi:NADH-quinone oxidoreductase subunit H
VSPFAHGALYGVLIITVVMTATALALWFERKFAARMQSRLGPTLVGPAGLLQPIADVLKLLQKEDIIPKDADALLFNIAPLLVAVAALGAAALIPFSPEVIAADLDVGVLYILAVGALGVLGIFMAGWASNNKFALLGGMRAIAQSLSYEVPLVLSALVPVILTGTMSAGKIVQYQADHHWLITWPFFLGIPAFCLFFLSMLAESNRIPFDIPEAESELVAGVTTEYTGMKFALFYMGEYIHTLVASAVAAALFLGGWDGPFLPGLGWMVAKTLLLFVVVYWVRWTLLRFRSDQLMRICWQWLVPAAVVLVLAAGAWVALGGQPWAT